MRTFKASRRDVRMKNFLIAASVMMAGSGWTAETDTTSDPLMNLFIQKGYVTQQEAAKVKAEAERLRTNELAAAALPVSRWKIDPGIENMELFGDVRVRYEGRKAT